MIVDHSYKVSTFGNFADIQPTTDNMMYLLEKFQSYEMIPSIFQEIQIDAAQPIVRQRIALFSSDSKEQLSISLNRIDFEITLNDENMLDDQQLSETNKKIIECFNIILEKFNKKSTRLAMNADSFVINLSDIDIQNIISKYKNPISIYNNTQLGLWSTRMMVQKEIDINGQKESSNIITNLAKMKGKKQHDGEITETNLLSIHVDINTLPNKNSERFSAADLNQFIKGANHFWRIIISEIGDAK